MLPQLSFSLLWYLPTQYHAVQSEKQGTSEGNTSFVSHSLAPLLVK